MKHFIIVGLLVVGISLTLKRFLGLDTNTFTMLNVILGIIGVYIVQRIQEKEK
ncbi:MAG: hypothetical protein N4A35_09040 [Flavobacteriales bacterium]|jgi:hypothetical protein|nr:hypothetical protein [Flavobacteriales bacterium]